MPSHEEKLKRKQILDDLSRTQKETFEKSLPISRENFRLLFDFLDNELSDCDDTLKLTQEFLQESKIANVDLVIQWLEEHGGYCDCEVLANIEEEFN
ncbi:MAG TPA: DUF2695 domain-containing protein [Segetibacter sp.]|jgi:hypothetical protein